jgi:hypothetical protein
VAINKFRCAHQQKIWLIAQHRGKYRGPNKFCTVLPEGMWMSDQNPSPDRTILGLFRVRQHCYKRHRRENEPPLSSIFYLHPLPLWALLIGHSLVIGPWTLVIAAPAPSAQHPSPLTMDHGPLTVRQTKPPIQLQKPSSSLQSRPLAFTPNIFLTKQTHRPTRPRTSPHRSPALSAQHRSTFGFHHSFRFRI